MRHLGLSAAEMGFFVWHNLSRAQPQVAHRWDLAARLCRDNSGWATPTSSSISRAAGQGQGQRGPLAQQMLGTRAEHEPAYRSNLPLHLGGGYNGPGRCDAGTRYLVTLGVTTGGAPVGECAVTILFLLLLLDSQLNRTQIAAIDGCHVANVTVRGKRQGLFIISVELILLLPSSQ